MNCTCPRIATARGLVPTGDVDNRCPAHGPFNARKPVIPPRPRALGAEGRTETGEKMLHCEECGRVHPPDVLRCDYVDET